MIDIAHKLITVRELEYLTAIQYVTTLRLLNGDKPFTSLTFLSDPKPILAMLERTYAPSSVKTKVGQIVAVLSLFPRYKKAHDTYQTELMSRAAALQTEEQTGKMNEKQTENWIRWDEVIAKRDELVKSARSQSELLDAVVLSLYTYIPPRRNKDYLQMFIVPTLPKDELYERDKNYLTCDTHELIFNTYKTASTYGTQVIPIPSPLWSILSRFIATLPKGDETPLIQKNGKHYNGVSSITDILNRIFGKKIGASALRHIYLSDKYQENVEERKDDSHKMAHSLSQQKDYIKKRP